MKKNRRLVFLLIFIGIIYACKHEIPVTPSETTTPVDTIPAEEDPCDPDSVYFQQDILPIFISNCAYSGCHDAGTAEEGVVLDSYENIISTGDIRPGRPDKSEVYEKITTHEEDERMPPSPKNPLTADQIALIEKWINQGAKNLSCSSGVCDTSNVKYSTTIVPILTANCRGCHSGASPSGGVDLSTYEGVAGVAINGNLNGVINHLSGYVPMPQGGAKLSACNIRKIQIWISNGIQND